MRNALASSIACFAATVATYLFFVRTGTGQSLDNRLTPTRSYAWSWLLSGYDRHVLIAEILVTVVILVVAVRRRMLLRGLLCAALPSVALVETDAAQALLRRPGLTGSTHNSFPSGHVALAAATVIALALVLPRGWRLVVGVLGTDAVALVALATTQAGWHRPSDLLGGVLVAATLGSLVVAFSRPAPADSDSARSESAGLDPANAAWSGQVGRVVGAAGGGAGVGAGAGYGEGRPR